MDFIQRMATSPRFQRIVNTKGISAFFGFWANRRLPPFILRRIIKSFIRSNAIDMDDYDLNWSEIHTFNDFFTRRLRPGSRNFNGLISSPVEGFCSQSGCFGEETLQQVKGKTYPLRSLIQAKPIFSTGSFINIYLSPANYHRVHAPFDFQLHTVKHVPGQLYSLNHKNIQLKDHIYCHNERVVIQGRSEYGEFYLVMVGAIIVGKIKLGLFPSIKPGECIQSIQIDLKRGDEIGWFELGSTVILITDSQHLANVDFPMNERVKLGQTLC